MFSLKKGGYVYSTKNNKSKFKSNTKSKSNKYKKTNKRKTLKRTKYYDYIPF